MVSTCESSAMTAIELPSAIPAVSSGSVAASSEPNTRNRTTSAASGAEPGRADARPRSPAFATWPFDLDLDAVLRRRLCAVSTNCLRLAGRDLGRLLGEGHVRERDPAGARDLGAPAARRAMRSTRRRASAATFASIASTWAAHGRVGHLALLDRDDDLLAVSGRLRRHLLQQGQGMRSSACR